MVRWMMGLGLVVLLSTPSAWAQETFPASWVGKWAGPSQYVPVSGDTLDFRMELHIAPTHDPARHTWTIVYLQDGQREERAYELVTVDAATGHYQIDEKNSIVLDSSYLNGTLYSLFAIGQVQIFAQYRKEEEAIVVEMISVNAMAPVMSGGEGEAPPVRTYPVRGLQRAELVPIGGLR